MTDLMALSPELVLGQCIVITSCDSGAYKPPLEALNAEWRQDDDVALILKVHSISDLPMPGFDEWYVFDSIPKTSPKKNFVNRHGFSPLDKNNNDANLFWSQIDTVRPLHALGSGTPNMFLVTRDKATFELAKNFNLSA